MPTYNKETLQDMADHEAANKEWAAEKQKQLQSIEQTGSRSVWEGIKSLPNVLYQDARLNMGQTNFAHHPDGYDDNQWTNKLYDDAKARAYNVYDINQRNQALQPGQAPEATPAPVSGWTNIVNRGR